MMKKVVGDEEEGPDSTTDQDVPFLFTELLELTEYSDGAREWKETVRWVRYEETVEEAGNRWSKPHVSTPALHGALQLRRYLKTGIVLLDLEASNLLKISNSLVEVLVTQGDVSRDTAIKLKDLYILKHRHQFEGPRKVDTGLAAVIKELLVQKLESKKQVGLTRSKDPSRVGSPLMSRRGSNLYKGLEESVSSNLGNRRDIDPLTKDLEDGKVNRPFLKKLPGNAEAAVVLVGSVPFVDKPISAFIRLVKPVVLGDLPEVDIPTRFLYFLVVPKDLESGLTEIGKSMGSAFSDKPFSQSIFEADSRDDLVVALDSYMDAIKTLPRDWNSKHYIEPPGGLDEKEKELQEHEDDVIDDDRRNREASGLVRTGRLFGGLINDIKRKTPHYLSDFRDGLSTQCVSSFLFLYFACLAPIVAFGALLGEATEQRIATIEGLVAGLISGVLFSLFSGQPLNLLGSTGPVYVFEKILYEMCADQNWDYLSLRLWIGIWVGAMLILLVATDASAYVCYITRFTEELFATLVAFIFIMSAFKNTLGIRKTVKSVECLCQMNNSAENLTMNNIGMDEKTTMPMSECLENNGQPFGPGCEQSHDVFLMSVLLFFGAFFISITLKQFRTAGYFPSWVRNFLSDFAVIIGILCMTSLDYFSGVPTPKLNVPSEFKPTWEQRSWLVTHALLFPEHLLANPWWVDVFLAPVFALLATILIFMDQQITAVIVNRKEYKLRKGCGYHLDLLVLALIVVVSSVFGLPWFIANTIPSINHMQSLTKESKTNIPGEKPQFLGIREQRVTSLIIAILTGLSVLMTPILALLPMPVLYGVFLFMGVSSLRGLQFFDRLLLLFMPDKYQPNFVYLKYVPLKRVHLFTGIQLMSLIGLWFIKSIPQTSIAFPIMLVIICFIRKIIECIFTKQELRALDDLLPESGSKNKRKLGYKISPDQALSESDEEDGGLGLKMNAKTPNYTRDNGFRRRQHKVERVMDMYDEELDEIMLNQNRTRKHKLNGGGKNTRSPLRIPAVPSSPNFIDKKVTMYLRMDSDDIFTPIHLSPLTMENLVKTLKSKFAPLRQLQITTILEKKTKGLTFPLDDSMLDFFLDHQVFVVSTVTGEQGDTTLTMSEVKME